MPVLIRVQVPGGQTRAARRNPVLRAARPPSCARTSRRREGAAVRGSRENSIIVTFMRGAPEGPSWLPLLLLISCAFPVVVVPGIAFVKPHACTSARGILHSWTNLCSIVIRPPPPPPPPPPTRWPDGTLESAVQRSRVIDIGKQNARMAGGPSKYEWGNLVCRRGAWSGCCCNGTCVQERCTGRLSGTIGCHFLRMGVEPAELAALSDAIAGYAAAHNLLYDPLPASTLVVHLRLGDTARTTSDDDVEQRDLNAKITRLPRGVKRIVLTGALSAGGHGDMPAHFKRSVQYVQLMTRLYERQGYEVHQRITGIGPEQVDEDIVFMTRAMHFHCDQGTFSRLLAQVIDYRGGMVYPPETCLLSCSGKPHSNSTTFRTDIGLRAGRPAGSRL